MLNRSDVAELRRPARLWMSLALVLLGTGAASRALAQTLVVIEITAPRDSVPLGNELSLTAIGIYSDGSIRTLSGAVGEGLWSSSNGAVATVDHFGRVTPITAGTAEIRLKVGDVLGSFNVTVIACVEDSNCVDANLCTRDTCNTSTGVCQHTGAVDCSAAEGPCSQPGVCVPASGTCSYEPRNEGETCTPNPSDPSCLFYSCTNLVCTRQCGAYTFSGLFPPVQNSPILNGAKAGSAIPMKFSLSGNQGLNILAEGYPTSQQVTCANVGTLLDMPLLEPVSPSASTLSYDAASGQYSYIWKTDKLWAGTCRQFVLRLRDGSFHIPYFQFK
jgi:hypothetical protein